MIRTKMIRLGLVLGLAFSGAFTPHVLAQTEAETPAPTRQFGAVTGEIVIEAQDLMRQEKYESALNKLSDASSLEGLNAYEKSTIFQMQGACFYELDQYEESISAFQNAVAAGGLLQNERRALEFNIAQLLIATDQFEKGAVMIEKWHAQGGKFKKGHIEMLWQAWSQAGRYDKALPWAEQWFNAAGDTKTRKHYDTLNFLYNNLGMPEKQMTIVEQMIEKWPDDKTLWDALATMMASNGQEEAYRDPISKQ